MTDQLSVSTLLEDTELRYLLKMLGGGWVVGLENSSASEEDYSFGAEDPLNRLTDLGYAIKTESGGYQVDDILLGMLYSLINAKDVLITKESPSGRTKYYYFLPDWQMGMCDQKGKHLLTFYKNREAVIDDILGVSMNTRETEVSGSSFVVGETDLELATFLFSKGDTNAALDLLGIDDGQLFLQEYVNSKRYLQIFLTKFSKTHTSLSTKRHAMLETSTGYYWVLYDITGDDVSMLFANTDFDDIRRQISNLLTYID